MGKKSNAELIELKRIKALDRFKKNPNKRNKEILLTFYKDHENVLKEPKKIMGALRQKDLEFLVDTFSPSSLEFAKKLFFDNHAALSVVGNTVVTNSVFENNYVSKNLDALIAFATIDDNLSYSFEDPEMISPVLAFKEVVDSTHTKTDILFQTFATAKRYFINHIDTLTLAQKSIGLVVNEDYVNEVFVDHLSDYFFASHLANIGADKHKNKKIFSKFFEDFSNLLISYETEDEFNNSVVVPLISFESLADYKELEFKGSFDIDKFKETVHPLILQKVREHNKDAYSKEIVYSTIDDRFNQYKINTFDLGQTDYLRKRENAILVGVDPINLFDKTPISYNCDYRDYIVNLYDEFNRKISEETFSKSMIEIIKSLIDENLIFKIYEKNGISLNPKHDSFLLNSVLFEDLNNTINLNIRERTFLDIISKTVSYKEYNENYFAPIKGLISGNLIYNLTANNAVAEKVYQTIDEISTLIALSKNRVSKDVLKEHYSSYLSLSKDFFITSYDNITILTTLPYSVAYSKEFSLPILQLKKNIFDVDDSNMNLKKYSAKLVQTDHFKHEMTKLAKIIKRDFKHKKSIIIPTFGDDESYAVYIRALLALEKPDDFETSMNDDPQYTKELLDAIENGAIKSEIDLNNITILNSPNVVNYNTLRSKFFNGKNQIMFISEPCIDDVILSKLNSEEDYKIYMIGYHKDANNHKKLLDWLQLNNIGPENVFVYSTPNNVRETFISAKKRRLKYKDKIELYLSNLERQIVSDILLEKERILNLDSIFELQEYVAARHNIITDELNILINQHLPSNFNGSHILKIKDAKKFLDDYTDQIKKLSSKEYKTIGDYIKDYFKSFMPQDTKRILYHQTKRKANSTKNRKLNDKDLKLRYFRQVYSVLSNIDYSLYESNDDLPLKSNFLESFSDKADFNYYFSKWVNETIMKFSSTKKIYDKMYFKKISNRFSSIKTQLLKYSQILQESLSYQYKTVLSVGEKDVHVDKYAYALQTGDLSKIDSLRGGVTVLNNPHITINKLVNGKIDTIDEVIESFENSIKSLNHLYVKNNEDVYTSESKLCLSMLKSYFELLKQISPFKIKSALESKHMYTECNTFLEFNEFLETYQRYTGETVSKNLFMPEVMPQIKKEHKIVLNTSEIAKNAKNYG